MVHLGQIRALQSPAGSPTRKTGPEASSLAHQAARQVLTDLLLPLLRRRRWARAQRRARQQRAQRLFHTTPRPTPETLLACELFHGWPRNLLVSLAATMAVEEFPAGAPVVLEGDPGDRMYFLQRGEVEVALRPRGSKRRTRGTATVVATLRAGDYFGESALLAAAAPRPVSVYTSAAAAATCWALGGAEVRAHLSLLPAAAREAARACGAELHARALARYYALSPALLAGVPAFAHWTPEMRATLAAAAVPVAVPAHHPVFPEGASSTSLFLVASGTVQLWKDAAAETLHGPNPPEGQLLAVLHVGAVFGEVGCLLSEPQPYAAKALTPAVLWQVPRRTLHRCGLLGPAPFRASQEGAAAARGAWFRSVPATAMLTCPALRDRFRAALPDALRQLRRLLRPKGVGAGEEVLNPGVLFVTVGRLAGSHTLEPDASVSITTLDASDPEPEALRAVLRSEVWTLDAADLRRVLRAHSPHLAGTAATDPPAAAASRTPWPPSAFDRLTLLCREVSFGDVTATVYLPSSSQSMLSLQDSTASERSLSICSEPYSSVSAATPLCSVAPSRWAVGPLGALAV